MTLSQADIPPSPAVHEPINGAPNGFASSYPARSDGFDEMLEADGSIRPHWRTFVSMLDDLGPTELLRRWDQARRIIHENGVTHNVYGDPNGLDRPWNLDFAPLLIPAEQWRALDVGLMQRAKLLDLLLADLYGPARTITDGVLPPELLYANPGFLRQCHGIRPPGDRWLHLYAADLGRFSDGNFVVLSDRTQAPSGAGYTLENRIVISRVLPSLFRNCNVQRLAPFFIALRSQLAAMAPANRENPRIVLLTPGPYNETYFEHAYLSRYLGYTLVQGNDLTVRDRRVYLKTLSGLQRVDVILRRVDDDYCDPLELYQRSFLGVPGLLEAIREGNVAVANALGTGLLQSPCFLPYMQDLCRYLLGEDLKLPSVRTWWCGDRASYAYVLANLPKLVIKPAFPSRGGDPIFGEHLTAPQLAELSGRIAAKPIEFIAQEKMVPSTAPVLLDQQVQRRHLVIRTFLAANNGSFVTMHGGLTRVTASTDSLVVSLQKGGGSKDTWILADGPVSDATLLPSATQSIELSRGGGDLPSRVADDLFWIGRYVERAESIIRLARGTLVRIADQSGFETSSVLDVLTHTLTGKVPVAGGRSEQELLAALLDPARPIGLRVTIRSLHDLARVVRDRISADAWRILQNVEQEFSSFTPTPGQDQLASVLDLLNRLVINLAAFDGMALDSMTRGQAWQFLDIGRRVERTIDVCRLLRSTLVNVVPNDGPLLEAVLEIGDSALTYRRRYLTHLQAVAVADLLLADETNPRSAAYQLTALEDHLSKLPRESSHPLASPDLQLVMKLRAQMRMTNLEAECVPVNDRRVRLEALLADLIAQMATVSESIGHIYFTHALGSRHLLVLGQESLL